MKTDINLFWDRAAEIWTKQFALKQAWRVDSMTPDDIYQELWILADRIVKHYGESAENRAHLFSLYKISSIRLMHRLADKRRTEPELAISIDNLVEELIPEAPALPLKALVRAPEHIRRLLLLILDKPEVLLPAKTKRRLTYDERVNAELRRQGVRVRSENPMRELKQYLRGIEV